MTDTTRPHYDLADAGADADADPSAVSPARPTFGRAVGRYLLIEPVGRGGCGEVFSAFDPMLDRKVAIKLLHRRSVSDAEIVQEGRILARFSHPNVVPVFDVGVDDGQAFLAMEYVAGGDLRRWLEDGAPEDAVEALLGVARGLAAAHEAGIVHGDIKPANVLVGAPGRLLISDFGIARSANLRSLGSTEPDVAGTPAYMAPEQARGGASPLSDQYSFCVMATQVLEDASPPGRVTAALQRGVANDPAERWPSMHALASALAPRRGRRPWQIAAIAALAVAGGLGAANAGRDDTCAHASNGARAAWGSSQQAKVRTAIEDSDVAEPERTWTRTAAGIAGYADALGQMRVGLCRASAQDEIGEGDRLRRATCLDRAQFHLGAVVRQLGAPGMAAHADKLRDGLPALERCLDPDEALPPPEVAATVAALSDELTEIDVLHIAEQLPEAWHRLESVMPDVEAAGHAPLWIRSQLVRAFILQARDRDDDAVPVFEGALASAIEHGIDRYTLKAASGLGYLLGARLQRHEEGLIYADLGLSYAARMGSPPAEAASARSNRAAVLSAQGNVEGALREMQEVLALRIEAYGPNDRRVSSAHSDLSVDLRKMGRLEEAEAHRRKALTLRAAVLGDTHPATQRLRTNLATLLAQRGKGAEGERHAREALAHLDGSDHAYATMMAKMALAHALMQQDRYDEAVQQYHAVLELVDPARKRHVDLLGVAVRNLASALGEQGRGEEAERSFARALQIMVEALGPEHPRVASARVARSANLVELGRLDTAREQAQLALNALQSTPGVSPVVLAEAVCAVGIIHRHEGALPNARTELQRCVELREAGDEIALAEARFELARVLQAQGDHGDAIALARAAAEASAPETGREIRDWLAEHADTPTR